VLQPFSARGGAVVAVLGCAALLLALAPRGLLAAGLGATFGVVNGVAYTLAAALLAAAVAFGIGRALGLDGVRGLLGRRWQPLQHWLARHGFVAVVGARLLPLAPFGLLNYAFGATAVRMRVFLPATVLGIAPSTVVYVVAGSEATDHPVSAVVLAGGFGAVMLAGAELLRRRRSRTAASAQEAYASSGAL
jgi:MYXO-CTERM domain-containing protein